MELKNPLWKARGKEEINMKKYSIVDVPQGSDAWLQWRRDKLGASDTPTIMGENPWKTPYQLWVEKTSNISVQQSPAMERGLKLEPLVRDFVNRDLKANYQPVCMQSCDRPYMIASLDGWDESLDLKLVEIKCPGSRTHQSAVDGQLPSHYIGQLQHQMFVANVDQALYFSYDGESYAKVLVQRDDEYITKMLAAAAAFNKCLQTGVAPELCDRDYLVVNDLEALKLEQRYRHIKEQVNFLLEEQELIKKSLIVHAAENNAIIGKLRLTKYVRKGAVEYNKIEALKSIDLNAYRKPDVHVWVVNEGTDT